jgi:hypothetical protein
MARPGETRAESLLLRPRRDLWLAAWAACAAFVFPLFLSLYLITIPTGRWAPFAAAHALVMGAFALAAQRLHGAGIHLSRDGIRERAYFLSTVFTPVDRIASVLVVRLLDWNSEDMSRQLFIVDAAGQTLLRIRGQLWHAADFDRIVHFYAVPVHVVEDPMTWSELRRSKYRHNLSKWERQPHLTGGAITLFLALIAFAPLLVVVPLLDR